MAKDPIGDETVNKSLLIDSHCEASSFCATFSLNSLLIKIIQTQAMLVIYTSGNALAGSAVSMPAFPINSHV